MADFNVTIDQTLSRTVLVQTVFNEQLVGIGYVSGAPKPIDKDLLSETAYAGSSLSTIEGNLVVAAADASNTLTFEVFSPLEATAIASESYLGSIYDCHLSPAGAKASSSIKQYATVSLDSSATVTETFVLSQNTSLGSTASASDVVSPIVTYIQTVIATASAGSSFITGLSETLSSTANATFTVTHSAAVIETLTGVASVEGTFPFLVSTSELLLNTGFGSSSFSFEGSVFNRTLESTANASGTIWAKDFNAVAWVLNTQSGGLSNYDNFGFTSLASHNGVLYATSPEGVFKLNADKDESRNIGAVIETGFLDFSTENKKRISDIYVGYTGGELECDVETYGGPEEVYTYEMGVRDANAPRNNRLKVGRGLSSRYWRLTFRNIDGADFQIHDVAVEVAKSKRRL